jgi:group II intron reverse transcriptase/maturase
MEDKLLQYGVAQILQTIYEEDFLSCSYGYRNNLGALDAVKDLRNKLSEDRMNYVLDADIKGFFDNLDHNWLVKMLELRIDDKAFIQLIKKWLKAGILDTSGKVIHPVTGTPQGGIVSPVLANIYLHYVLVLWFENVVKKHCKGKAYIYVYADDFVCVFEHKYDAYRFYNVLGKRFEKFGLSLAKDKTNIVSFIKRSEEKFDFLGFEFRRSNSRQTRVKIRTSRSKLKLSKKTIKEWIKMNRHMRLWNLFSELNAKLTGYYNYYGIRGNYKSLSAYQWIVRKALFKWLNRRSQRRSYTIDDFDKILNTYKIVKPHIME